MKQTLGFDADRRRRTRRYFGVRRGYALDVGLRENVAVLDTCLDDFESQEQAEQP